MIAGQEGRGGRARARTRSAGCGRPTGPSTTFSADALTDTPSSATETDRTWNPNGSSGIWYVTPSRRADRGPHHRRHVQRLRHHRHDQRPVLRHQPRLAPSRTAPATVR